MLTNRAIYLEKIFSLSIGRIENHPAALGTGSILSGILRN